MPERIRPGLVAAVEQRDRWKRVRPLFGRLEKDRHRYCSRACAGESERFTDECEGMLAVGMRAVTYVPPEQFGTDRRVNSVIIEIRRDLYMEEVTGEARGEAIEVRT